MAASLEDVFLAELDDHVRTTFEGVAMLDATLAELYNSATAAFPDVIIDAPNFAAELARRLGAAADPAQLARVRADHLYLAIACAAGDAAAIRRFEAEFIREVDAAARRLRARPDQADEVRGHLHRILFVSEPGRIAALRQFSGRGDLGGYVRVLATRELLRVIKKGRAEVGISDEDFIDMLSPASDVELGYLRQHYCDDVSAAMSAALASLDDRPRALLRYSVIDGWSIDRIAALYGVHRATAARWVAAAREELGVRIRAELVARMAIIADEADSIVRLVQSRIEVSLERLLG
jgi:RNA polymerase sigma-70 factor, ECF subfamily